jgi:hypothetical protein
MPALESVPGSYVEVEIPTSKLVPKMAGMKYGYARTSTGGQTTAL